MPPVSPMATLVRHYITRLIPHLYSPVALRTKRRKHPVGGRMETGYLPLQPTIGAGEAS